MEKFRNSLKKFDAFGEGINFKINRRDRFGTTFGAVITLAIYVVVLIYAQMKL